MKPFDLEKAKSGKPVCTRDGRKARIICFDRKCKYSCYTIIALVGDDLEDECYSYNDKGLYSVDKETENDLMMESIIISKYVNVYTNRGVVYVGRKLYDTEEEALKAGEKSPLTYMGTTKIEWEE